MKVFGMQTRLLFVLLLLVTSTANATLVRWDWTGRILEPYQSTCNSTAPLFDLCEALSNTHFHGSWVFEGDDVVPGAQGVLTTGGFSIVVDDVFAMFYVGGLFMSKVPTTPINGPSLGAFQFGTTGDGQYLSLNLLDGTLVPYASLSRVFLGYPYSYPSFYSTYEFSDLNPPPPSSATWAPEPVGFIQNVALLAATAGMPITIDSWVRVPEPDFLDLFAAGLLAIGFVHRHSRRAQHEHRLNAD